MPNVYDHAHRKLRAKWVPKVKAGGVNCWRCGLPIQPDDVWHLGHDDQGQTRGPEHASECNLHAAGSHRPTDKRQRPRRQHPSD